MMEDNSNYSMIKYPSRRRSNLLKKLVLVSSVLFSFRIPAQANLKILSPANGIIVQPGSKLKVVVSVSGTYQYVSVVAEVPINASEPKSVSPFEFTLSIPQQIESRSYHITAIGSPSISGKPDFDKSDQVTIKVGKASGAVELKATPALIYERLHSVQAIFGSRPNQLPIQVLAVFPDGSQEWVDKSSDIRFEVKDPNVGTMNHYVFTAVAPGKTTLEINYHGANASIPITIDP